MRRQRVYSEAVRLEVVRGLEKGRFESVRAASAAYGIGGSATVERWVRQYGREHLLNKVVRVMKADEQSEAKQLKQRVRELERALADAHMDAKLGEAYLRLACERAGISDVAAFKKKHDVRR